ncbi:DUF3854 domain-containing protein [Cyanobacteria bacterium FACHB-63]|nr:DUF3854 domain-containing protein [Cyanobacteria bacterium FACHB-63]
MRSNDFSQAIRKEFIEGSAIAPDLYNAAIEFHRSLEIDALGNISAPIHEILGWRYVRFGNKVQEEFYGAFFCNEDGSYWHSKLSNDPINWKKTRKQLKNILGRNIAETEVLKLIEQYPQAISRQRYTAPKGNGNKAFFPPIPESIRRKISDRYGVEIPLDVPFWEWLKDHPEIPLLILEGGKKALCALSLGFVAISVYGSSCGLSPDLEPYFVEGRHLTITFDQDNNFETRQRVRSGISMIGFRAKKAKSQCFVAEWMPSQGKGFDDFVVQCGADTAIAAIEGATPFVKWRSAWMYEVPDHYQPTIVSTVRTLKGNPEETQRILDAIKPEHKLIMLAPGKSFGKTELIKMITKGSSVLALYHRIQLAVDAAKRLGIPDLNTLRKKSSQEDKSLLQMLKDSDSLALCLNSFQPNSNPGFVAADWFDVDYVSLDEIEQSLWYLLDSNLLQDNGLRVAILREFLDLLRYWASPESKTKLILADADLSLSVRFFEAIAGRNIPYFYLKQEYAGESYPARFYENPESLYHTLIKKLYLGEKVFVFTSSQGLEANFSSSTLEQQIKREFPHLKVLRIDSETIDLKGHPAFGCMAKLNDILTGFDVVIASPLIETGVSFDVEGHFDSVFGFLPGNIAESSARQALIRVRELVPRHIYAEKCASFAAVAGTNNLVSGQAILEVVTKSVPGKMALIKDQLLDAATDQGEIDSSVFQEALEVWALMAARHNMSQYAYRETIIENLKAEGCEIIHVEKIDTETKREIRSQISEARLDEMEVVNSEIAESRLLTEQEYESMSIRPKESPQQQRELRKYELTKQFRLDETNQEVMTPEAIGKASHGWYSKIELHYFLTVGRAFLPRRDAAKVRKASLSGQIFAPDLAKVTIGDKVAASDLIGFTDILSRLEAGEKIPERDPQLQEMRLRMLKYPEAMRAAFGIRVLSSGGNVKAAHTLMGELLELIGLLKQESNQRAVAKSVAKFGDKEELLSQNLATKCPIEKAYGIATHTQALSKATQSANKRGVRCNPHEVWSLEDGRFDFFELWIVKDFAQSPEAMKAPNQTQEPILIELAELDQVIEAMESKPKAPAAGVRKVLAKRVKKAAIAA